MSDGKMIVARLSKGTLRYLLLWPGILLSAQSFADGKSEVHTHTYVIKSTGPPDPTPLYLGLGLLVAFVAFLMILPKFKKKSGKKKKKEYVEHPKIIYQRRRKK